MSPTLQSPTLQSPTLQSPTLQSPASVTPAHGTPAPRTPAPVSPALEAARLRSAPAVLAWPDHLDALEEWLRRGRALFSGADGVVDLPPLVSVPQGPLPDALRLRAAVALQELGRLQELAERRLDAARRGAAYRRY